MTIYSYSPHGTPNQSIQLLYLMANFVSLLAQIAIDFSLTFFLCHLKWTYFHYFKYIWFSHTDLMVECFKYTTINYKGRTHVFIKS